MPLFSMPIRPQLSVYSAWCFPLRTQGDLNGRDPVTKTLNDPILLMSPQGEGYFQSCFPALGGSARNLGHVRTGASLPPLYIVASAPQPLPTTVSGDQGGWQGLCCFLPTLSLSSDPS